MKVVSNQKLITQVKRLIKTQTGNKLHFLVTSPNNKSLYYTAQHWNTPYIILHFDALIF